MSVLQCTPMTQMAVGVSPREWRILTDDTYAEVTTSSYLTNLQNTYNFSSSDFAIVYTTDLGSVYLTISVSSGVVSLVNTSDSSVITYPVTLNYMAAFSATSSSSSTVKNGASTIINPGNIQAGLSGTSGYVDSFPSTATTGRLRLAAVSNTLDYTVTISNSPFGQSSVVSLPDPVGATATFALCPAALTTGNLIKASSNAGLLADAGYNLKSATTASYAGGGTSNAFTATGITTTSKVTASIVTSTNNVSITKVVPTSNTLTISFSADPGANTTVNWIATSVAVA
jgi:hypothetical protein